MGSILDKHSVLDRIKLFYGLKGNADLSRFLGVAPNTITNWYGRRSFDIDVIYTKCVDVNLDWLLTGRGEMFRSELSSIQRNDNQELLIEKIEKLEEEKERLISIIDNQNMLLKRLQEENKMSRSGTDNEAQGLVG